MSTYVRCLGLTVLLCAIPALCLGQARFAGRVVDPNGAAVAQVQVTVTALGAGTATASTQTSSSGEFAFSDLMPGTYVVRSALTGFAQWRMIVRCCSCSRRRRCVI